MRVTIPVDEAAADAHLPSAKPDGSGVGVNYADQILKPFKQTLPDGRKLTAKRRGLKITLAIGDTDRRGHHAPPRPRPRREDDLPEGPRRRRQGTPEPSSPTRRGPSTSTCPREAATRSRISAP